ncbi:G1/S-specific cyclin-D3-like [Tropilaelaps mercedesae]|uniref:G1/S-specific cyclin-D3-like n=1 Tax=Tropilaelaps mercedesae TaxID=418985 RepID=A0A1V9XAV8_9ACAR|nr:G1/S-specific cyclin-D3-like [Tropilaelaps mercedesae]
MDEGRYIEEPSFVHHPASLLAAGCVAAAVKGFYWSRGLIYPAHHRDDLILTLAQLTGHTPARIVRCLMDIDMIATASRHSCPDVGSKSSPPKSSGGVSPTGAGYVNSTDGGAQRDPADCTTPTNQEVGHKFQPETPTDVQDVDF